MTLAVTPEGMPTRLVVVMNRLGGDNGEASESGFFAVDSVRFHQRTKGRTGFGFWIRFLDPTNSKYLLDRLSECNRHVVSVLKCVESRIQNECDVDGWCD